MLGPIYFLLAKNYFFINILLYYLLKVIQINMKSKPNFKDMNIKVFLYTPIISLIIDLSRAFGFYYNKFKKLWIF